jgi:hypothetical protein
MTQQLVFLGYLPKRILPRPEWLKCANVEFVGSVSECISPAPPDRIDRWEHNDLGLYNTESAATAIIPHEHRAEYTVFAYAALPTIFHSRQQLEWNPWSKATTAPPALDVAYDEHLGFDIVGFCNSGFFECSPLSCNGAASEIAVNRFCLVDDLERAITIGKSFSAENSRVEPAWAYVVVDVRKRKLTSQVL